MSWFFNKNKQNDVWDKALFSGIKHNRSTPNITTPLIGLMVVLAVFSFWYGSQYLVQTIKRVPTNWTTNYSYLDQVNYRLVNGLSEVGDNLVIASDYIYISFFKTVYSLDNYQLQTQNQTALTYNTFDFLKEKWSLFVDSFLYYLDIIIDNWKNFLGGKQKQENVLTVDDLELLKEQIKQDLLKEINNYPLTGQTNNQDGLVVFPSGGQFSTSNIANMFSDPVVVNFDQSGKSGVVTPVFKTGLGDNYIFLLTPVKK